VRRVRWKYNRWIQ